MTINLDCFKANNSKIEIYSSPKYGYLVYIENNTIVNKYPTIYYDNIYYYSPQYKYFNYPTKNINNEVVINNEHEEQLTYKYYVEENLIYFKTLKIEVINIFDNLTMYDIYILLL